jgi:hypothetical protein
LPKARKWRLIPFLCYTVWEYTGKGGGIVPAQAYEIVALGARYWFAFLGVVIVWRSFMWLRKDARQRRKRLRQLPDAGLVGELVVLAGSDMLPPGTVIPLPREGTLGSLRSCDVSIPCSGVASRHGDFRFEEGVGLIITPAPHLSVVVDGGEPEPEQREWVMHHGSRLVIGDALLRMRLFMGLETARSAAFQQEPAVLELPPELAASEPEWQDEDGEPAPGYEQPQPVVMEDNFNPDWEEYTQPHRQQILSWQDTGRYTYDRQPPAGPEDGAEEWPAPYEAEQSLQDEWQDPEEAKTPPTLHGMFRRRRR